MGAERQAAALLQALDRARATVATAESLTGGRLAAALTAVPGASRSYLGGVVAYATSVKSDVLGVPQSLVDRHGVVSPECARAMADGVRRLTRATFAVSTTGVAGPDRQDGHPLGTVFLGVAGRGTRAVELRLAGGRAEIQEAACSEALALLLAVLREEETTVG